MASKNSRAKIVVRRGVSHDRLVASRLGIKLESRRPKLPEVEQEETDIM